MPKRELVRLVRTASGEVVVDSTGKLAGRGAYLCSDKRCWLVALNTERIGHALKVTLTDEELAQIRAYAAQPPEVDAEERQAG